MRVLLAAGCNHYDHLSPKQQLKGAEADASKIYELLVTPQGDYDPEASKLLLSPSLQDLRGALGGLFGLGSLDVLTLYFAGHGRVKNGYYYLCPSSVRLDNLSVTGWSLEDFFRIVSELRPREVNVVMDACQAGAAVMDLGGLLKPDIIGRANSSSVSFLAAAASNQYANEVNQGGIATTELARYLDGERLLQEVRPFLGLIEVGHAVSVEVVERESKQKPVSWGLSLYGPGEFAKNPRFSGDEVARREALVNLAPFSEVGVSIGRRSDELWTVYESMLDDPEYGRLTVLLNEVSASLEGGASQAVPFVRGVTASFRTRVRSSPDLLADTNVLASCMVALLPVLHEDGARILMRELLEERTEVDRGVRHALADNLNSDRYALLSPGGSLSDFYYLPLRVMKVVGWLASSVLLHELTGVGEDEDGEEALDLAESVINSYAGSVVAVSDAQAPYAYLLTEACRARGRTDLARLLVARLFKSLRSVGGAITRVSVDPGEAFEYTWLRSEGRPAEAGKAIVNPSQLLSCLMLCGPDLGLSAEMNAGMRSFDGRFVNIFLPEDYAGFAAEFVRTGVNHHRKIGHGVWRVEDLLESFEKDCRPSIEGNETIKSDGIKALCILASYLLPDRIPFFLQPRPGALGS